MPQKALLLAITLACAGTSVFADVLDTHTVVLDGTDQLLSWITPQDHAYAEAARMSAEFIIDAMNGPIDGSNGLPMIHTHSEYHVDTFAGSDWANNPAGKNAMLADGLISYYAFSGDDAAIDAVRELLDHQLAHGTTPSSYTWGDVPWSAAAEGSVDYGDDDIEGVGNLEPDKVGELGYHGYLRFYQFTGETVYLDAAIDCADALAANIRTGDATHSPWAFRVDAATGQTAHPADEYCDHVIATIRLFDELVRLGLGDVSAYQSARANAWSWLLTYPVQNETWAEYFEDIDQDVGMENQNQYNPGQTARYLLEHPEIDPNWLAHSTQMIDFIETEFGGTDQGESGLQYGARVIAEQDHYNYKMASHTSRFGAINALLFAATGDEVAREKAFRSLNWCTYMARDNGAVIEGPAEHAHNEYCWYSDGHGDYIRHFLLAMGAVPEWAPADEDHLLHTTSVVTSVAYSPFEIRYSTFDDSSREMLRVTAEPVSVTADGSVLPLRTNLDAEGWTWDAASGVVRIRHDSAQDIVLSFEQPPPGIFGDSGEGSFTTPLWSGDAWIHASRFLAHEDIRVWTILAKVTAISGSYKCAIYSDADGFPLTPRRSTSEVTAPEFDGWQVFPLSSSLGLEAGNYYWLAIWTDDEDGRIYADGGGLLRMGQYDYGNWPSPITTSEQDTESYSIYATDQQPADVGTQAPMTPDSPLSLTCEPNPFTFDAVLRFQLPAAESVVAVIVDPSGRRVRSLLHGSLPAGNHSVSWDGRMDDGRRAPTGTYLVRLRAGAREESRRISLVR